MTRLWQVPVDDAIDGFLPREDVRLRVPQLYAPLCSYFIARGLDSSRAEELVQDVLLTAQHVINANLLWNTNDTAEAVSAFGSGWNGGVPFTALIGRRANCSTAAGRRSMLDVRRVVLKNLTDDRYIGQHAYWTAFSSGGGRNRQARPESGGLPLHPTNSALFNKSLLVVC